MLTTIKTIKAAALVAAGKSVAGCISPGAVTLAEEAVAGMVAIKGKMILLVLALGLAVGGAGWAGSGLGEKLEPASQAPVAKEVAGVPAKKEPTVATDRYGDPLPEGAVARLGARRFRHEGSATALAFTPDGNTLVGRTNSGVILWDATTGKERLRLPGRLHNLLVGDAYGMDISPDGNILAISDFGPLDEPKISLWKLSTGEKMNALSIPKEHKDADVQFFRLCFAPDGKSLAWTSMISSKTVVFNVQTGQIYDSLGGRDSQPIYNLAISPDSKTLATAIRSEGPLNIQHHVQLRSMVTGKLISAIHNFPTKNAETFVGKLAFSSDGKILAFGIKDQILLFNLETRETSPIEARIGQVIGLGFTPDGKQLVCGGELEGKVCVCDVATGKILRSFGGGFQGRSMALSNDGKTVALGSDGNVIRIWDVATGREGGTQDRGHEFPVYHVGALSDGKTLYSAASLGFAHAQMFCWNLATGQRNGIQLGTDHFLSVSLDGRLLATAGKNLKSNKKILQGEERNELNSSTMRIRELANGTAILLITAPDDEDIVEALFSSDSTKILTLNMKWGKETKHKYVVRSAVVIWQPANRINTG